MFSKPSQRKEDLKSIVWRPRFLDPCVTENEWGFTFGIGFGVIRISLFVKYQLNITPIVLLWKVKLHKMCNGVTKKICNEVPKKVCNGVYPSETGVLKKDG